VTVAHYIFHTHTIKSIIPHQLDEFGAPDQPATSNKRGLVCGSDVASICALYLRLGYLLLNKNVNLAYIPFLDSFQAIDTFFQQSFKARSENQHRNHENFCLFLGHDAPKHARRVGNLSYVLNDVH